MKNLISYPIPIFHGYLADAQCGVKELVRGKEEYFLERLLPLVRTRSVVLDLSVVERIDAAGVSALIRLYCTACEAGCRFTVVNARPHVAEVLALLGLDEILVSQETESAPSFGLQAVAHAA